MRLGIGILVLVGWVMLALEGGAATGGAGSGTTLAVKTNGVSVVASATTLDIITGSNSVVQVTNAAGTVTMQVNANTQAGGGSASGGFVSGVTNIGYSTTNVFIDLQNTNHSVIVITNTGGPVNLLFTNLTLGYNFTVLIDGVDLDGTTSATNALVTYVWPHASVQAQWLGFTTNTYVTSNKVLGVSGFIRRTNSVILSSRE